MKNKIFYIGNFSFPFGNAAGSRVLGNGYLLRSLKYDVSFIGLDNNLSGNSNLKSTSKEYDNFQYFNLPYPLGIKGWLSYKKRFKEVIELIEEQEPFAVIIYGSPTISLFGQLLRKWCDRNKIIFITDCVDWLSGGGGGFIFRIVKYFDTFYQKRILNASCDGVIAISSYLSDYYRNRGCKTVIIPPLVHLKENYNYIPKNENNEINLVYVGQPFPIDGRIVREKSFKDRLDKVIEVLFKLKSKPFLFNIYGIEKRQYLSVIPDHRSILVELDQKIEFHGKIENSEAKNVVSRADFSILFRDNNRMTKAGFPTKFVESISCGTPIITTRTSDLEKYLVEGKHGYFVNMNNEEDLSNELDKIFSLDSKSINSMKLNCHNSKMFVYTNFGKDMVDFLGSINN